MENIVRIREILQELGYVVMLKQSDDGLTAIFPAKKIGINSPIEPIKRFYHPVYEQDKTGIDFYSTNLNPHNKFVDCPAYAVRLAITCDIISVCKYYDYNPKLIVVYDKDNNEISYNSSLKITDLLKEAEDTEHKELELKLREIVQKAIPANFSQKYLGLAKKYDVVEGYDFVKKILLGE